MDIIILRFIYISIAENYDISTTIIIIIINYNYHIIWLENFMAHIVKT